ncbi:MAG: hypothetical protein E8D41_00315 [Nitrospira sp.]|nr:MAG: hypothetical protein E8D41_00315 [Nitrospira sp.]
MTVANIGLTALLWLLCTLTIPGPSEAEIFFDSNFESCNVGTGNDFPCEGWDDFGIEKIVAPDHNSIEITNSLSFSGSKSVKGTFVNAVGGINNPSIWRNHTSTKHYFFRFATRQSPGFKIATNGHTKMVRFLDTTFGYPIPVLVYRYGTYQIVMEAPYDQADAYLLNSGVVPSQTSWDQVEVELLLNTPGQSNGLIRLWVNGVLRGETLNRQWIGPTPTSKCGNGNNTCPSTWSVKATQIFIQAGLGTIHYDRFAVGNTRIGLTTGQTSSDSTPPAIPSGVRAP